MADAARGDSNVAVFAKRAARRFPQPLAFNPLRNEADAFRVLVYFVVVVAVIVAIVLIVRAVS